MGLRRFVKELPHLVRRFFGTVTARPLGPAEQIWVSDQLREPERTLFWALSAADQRHSYATAQTVAAHGDLAVRAMLLHDVGKRHAAVGPIGRALATVCDALSLPMPDSWRRYRAHGELGADDLRNIGSEPEVVAFAGHHGADPPPGFDAGLWDVLTAADTV